jgi:HSP20 family protein
MFSIHSMFPSSPPFGPFNRSENFHFAREHGASFGHRGPEHFGGPIPFGGHGRGHGDPTGRQHESEGESGDEITSESDGGEDMFGGRDASGGRGRGRFSFGGHGRGGFGGRGRGGFNFGGPSGFNGRAGFAHRGSSARGGLPHGFSGHGVHHGHDPRSSGAHHRKHGFPSSGEHGFAFGERGFPFGGERGFPFRERSFPFGGDNKVRPSTDVSETDEQYVVEVELPGVRKQDITITIGEDGKNIHIAGTVADGEHVEGVGSVMTERVLARGMKFARTVRLPGRVKKEDAVAALEQGVLTIKVAKVVAEGVTVEIA